MPKSGNDAQELERLLALMRKEADADEEDAETDEEEEDSRSDNKIDQNIKDYIMGILSRHEPKPASKKGKGKAGKDPETDESETAETEDEETEGFTAADFETEDEPEEEPEAETVAETATEPEPEPASKDRSKDEIHRSASAHLRELREARKAGKTVPQTHWEESALSEESEEPTQEPLTERDEDIAPWEDAPAPAAEPAVTETAPEEPEEPAEPAEEIRFTPAFEEAEPEEEPEAEETVQESVQETVQEPETPEEVAPEPEEEFDEVEPFTDETAEELAQEMAQEPEEEMAHEPVKEEPAAETVEKQAEEAEEPVRKPAFEERPESISKEDAHPEDLNPEAMGDEARPGIMPNFRRSEPEEPDEEVSALPEEEKETEPAAPEPAEEAEISEPESADTDEEEPVLEEEYEEDDEEVEDPEIMWGSRHNRPHTDLVEDKDAGKTGFYGAEPSHGVPLEQTELEMPEAIAPVRPAPETPHGRRAVKTTAHLRARIPHPADHTGKLRDEDILMLRDLGMRDEALHMIGRRRYDEIIHNDLQFKKEHNLPIDPRLGGEEDSTGGIAKNKVKRKKLNTRSMSLVIRTMLTLFVTAVLFLMDTVGLTEFAGWFGIEAAVNNPLTLAIGLQMILVLYLISFSDFNKGVVGLFGFRPTLWSVPAVSLFLTVLYDGLLFFVPDGTVLPFLHVPFAVCLIWTLVAEMLNVAKDVRDFEVVTDGEIKYVLGRLPHRKRVRVDKDGHVSYVRDLDESGVKLGVIRTHRIRDFDGMSTKRPELMNAMRPILYAVPAIAVLLGVASYLFSGGTPTAYFNSVHLFGLLGLMTMPLSLVIAYSYPHLRAAVRLHHKGAALIGRCAGETVGPTSPRSMTDEDPTTPAEPKDKTYIVFHDDYMFRKMLEVRVRSLTNLDPAEALRRLGAIAKTLGGDLKRFLDIRNIPEREIGSIRVTRYKTNGIEYEYSRAPGLQYFGTGTFLTEHGVRIPDSLARSELDLERDVARLYMGGPNGLELSLDIVYMPDPAFVRRVRQLDGYGLYAAIQTHDPCLSEGFMYRMWTEQGRLLAKDGRRITMDVYKPFNFEEDYVTIDERCDLVADSEDGLCEAILTDRRLRLDVRRGIFRAWIGAGLGLLILFVLWLTNSLNLCNGLTVAVYQSVWCLVTMLFDPFQGRSRQEEAELKASRKNGKKKRTDKPSR